MSNHRLPDVATPYEVYEWLRAERDRRTRARDSLPKVRANTRKKLNAKRTEDRIRFKERIDAKRARRYVG